MDLKQEIRDGHLWYYTFKIINQIAQVSSILFQRIQVNFPVTNIANSQSPTKTKINNRFQGMTVTRHRR